MSQVNWALSIQQKYEATTWQNLTKTAGRRDETTKNHPFFTNIFTHLDPLYSPAARRACEEEPLNISILEEKIAHSVSRGGGRGRVATAKKVDVGRT